MRRAALVPLALAALLCTTGCPKAGGAARATYAGPPKAMKLLTETGEAETETRTEKRTDLSVTVENGEPVPYVVAVGEVGPFSRQGGTVKLYGDDQGREGWSVDNFVLLEVRTQAGKILRSAAIGFQQGVTRGSDQIDSLGQMRFAFGPGEVEISNLLPVDEQVFVKATALDVGGVGKVSNLYLILTSEPAVGGHPDEELRDK